MTCPVDVVVPGDPDVRVRIHRPVDSKGPFPCVVSMHAGGYTRGEAAMDDEIVDQWCRELPVVVVSVDYRLAPAATYPGPLMDCYTALTWIHTNADEYAVDRSLIGVHGFGAGGGLAAALALVARDHRDIPLAFQLLASPMLDDRQGTASNPSDPTSTELGWRAYLGDLYRTEDLPIYAAAARCTKLAGLPPAYISVGALDGFHDEDAAYAHSLNEAGVPTELHVHPGASEVAEVALDQINWLRKHLGR